MLNSVGLGFIASLLTGTLPGLGASQAAIISSSVKKKTTPEDFLVLIGAINTIVMIISFALMDKSRGISIFWFIFSHIFIIYLKNIF